MPKSRGRNRRKSVLQRARLRAQGDAPDILVMTATPIPRTLTMTLYGDLDVSVLDELPAHRGKIVTAVRDAAKLPDAVKFLQDSFAYLHKALNTIDESNVLGQVQSPFGSNKISRLGLSTIALSHPMDHYGQMVEYLRMNGIVPPASRGQ